MKNMSPSLSLLHTSIIYLTQNHSIYISAKEHVHVHVHVKISAKLANSELISCVYDFSFHVSDSDINKQIL